HRYLLLLRRRLRRVSGALPSEQGAVRTDEGAVLAAGHRRAPLLPRLPLIDRSSAGMLGAPRAAVAGRPGNPLHPEPESDAEAARSSGLSPRASPGANRG